MNTDQTHSEPYSWGTKEVLVTMSWEEESWQEKPDTRHAGTDYVWLETRVYMMTAWSGDENNFYQSHLSHTNHQDKVRTPDTSVKIGKLQYIFINHVFSYQKIVCIIHLHLLIAYMDMDTLIIK